MAVSAFSKVGDIDDDDEEEQRLEISQKAMMQYASAQTAYENKMSSEEVLRLFEEAEGTMQPLLCNGLASLEAKELETVLKGRLHQAVTLAQLGQADRWPRIKALAEDVLQFDFNNAHARWLRGLSLQHHYAKPLEAEQECRRAVECARMQGKDAEANSWEAEVFSTFACDPAAVTTPPTAKAAPPVTEPETKKSAMAKGFLNRGAKKTRAPEPAAEVPVPAAAEAAVAKAKQKEAELRSELAALAAQLKALEADRGREADDVAQALQDIKELPEELRSLSSSASALEAAQEKLLAGRTWAEKEQQRFVDVSTEVLTLQQMTLRESKEQEETAEKQCTELHTLSSRLQDQLKQLRQLEVKGGHQGDDEDVARLAHHVAAFQRLPWRRKVAAMLEDGALLWLLAFIVLLGMLFTLSLIVELWFSSKCRLTCEVAGAA